MRVHSVALLAALMGLVGCSAARPESTAGRPRLPVLASAASDHSDFYLGGARSEGPATEGPASRGSVDRQERLMVYRGRMEVVVPRPDEAVQRFGEQVKQWGGYVSQRLDATITCRIPALQFDAALAALRGYGRVTTESIGAQDVTDEARDLVIRLDNARRARERLLALMEKATAVEGLLAIEKELRRLTEEIERMEAEHKALQDRVAMATLSATFLAAAPSTSDESRQSRFPWINALGVEHVLRSF